MSIAVLRFEDDPDDPDAMLVRLKLHGPADRGEAPLSPAQLFAHQLSENLFVVQELLAQLDKDDPEVMH